MKKRPNLSEDVRRQATTLFLIAVAAALAALLVIALLIRHV